MSIIQSTAKSGGTATAGFYDYPIENSLRFDGSSYLSWSPTQTSSNQNKWTYSSWVKRTNIDQDLRLYASGGYATDSVGIDLTDIFSSSSDNMLTYWDYTDGSRKAYVRSSRQLRDTSAWYHILISYDVNTTPKMVFYINGDFITTFGDQPSEMNHINVGGRTYYMAADVYGGGTPLVRTGTFYLANIQFTDGQALDPYFFGESKNGVWIPYNAFSTAGSGTATASDGDTATDSYGTNGFHLTFEDATSTTTLGYDYSGNNNHWTLN